MAAGTLREKKQQQSRVVSALFFMFTLTWITEKELERVFNKTKETNFVGRKHGNSKRR